MKVSMADIKAKFYELINGISSREDIADFAIKAMEANDWETLLYEPRDDEQKIWKCILYLSGVDSKISPNTYLYSNEDFIYFTEENDISI